jgi:Ca2+-binding EF-hand superfamily protein
MPPRFETMDTDGDGAIEPDEAGTLGPWSRHFAEADGNDDNQVSRAEFDAFLAAHPPGDRDRDGDVDHWDCMAIGRTDAPYRIPTPPDFAGMDRNGDGYLTQDELPPSNWVRDHLTATDTDGDGRVSRAEFEAHHAEMEAMRH